MVFPVQLVAGQYEINMVASSADAASPSVKVGGDAPPSEERSNSIVRCEQAKIVAIATAPSAELRMKLFILDSNMRVSNAQASR